MRRRQVKWMITYKEFDRRLRGLMQLPTPEILAAWYRKRRRTVSVLPNAKRLDRSAKPSTPLRINVCCGPVKLPGYINIDIDPGADLVMDFTKDLFPFPDASAEIVVCMSAINFFTRERALEIIRDVHRVLHPGGIVRFGVQDLRTLAQKYLCRDRDFFHQRLSDGTIRFPGETFADKFGLWYLRSGFGKYVYDFESLALLFDRAGFIEIENRKHCESALPEIDTIDNRPEQMFYLEARKGFAADYTRKGIALWESGRKEEGWQYVLHGLDLDCTDRASVCFALDIIRAGKRRPSAISLIDRYRRAVPDDEDMEKTRAEVVGQIEAATLDRKEAETRRRVLDGMNARRNPILADSEHLQECMSWLRHAQETSLDTGVPVLFDMVSREWDISFAETTGYIIPTFLIYAHRSGDEDYRQIAMSMGDWEIDIQAVNGGVGEPVGEYNHPRIFNTGQVMLGWMAIFRATGEYRYLEAAEKAAHFVMRHLDAHGRWVDHAFLNAPWSYNVRTAWALLELFALTRYAPYRATAEANVRWVLQRAQSNGWFKDNSMSPNKTKAGTHPIAYTLVGLLKIYRLHNASCDYHRILRLLEAAADNLVRIYVRQRESNAELPYRGFPARFDMRWRSSNRWSCVTGNAQIAFFLRALNSCVDKRDYLAVADELLDELKTLHLVDGISDKAIRGGLCGSDPISGAYCSYAIPNWGVKFFADSLLQRTSSTVDLRYLG